jgi:hypothetical protein
MFFLSNKVETCRSICKLYVEVFVLIYVHLLILCIQLFVNSIKMVAILGHHNLTITSLEWKECIFYMGTD